MTRLDQCRIAVEFLVLSFLDFRDEPVREVLFKELVNQFLLLVADAAGIAIDDVRQCPLGDVIAAIVGSNLIGCFLLHILGFVQFQLNLVDVLVNHS